MSGMMQDLAASITGKLPKAILCVRQMKSSSGSPALSGDGAEKVGQQAAVLQKALLATTEKALKSGTDGALTGNAAREAALRASGYVFMEVQYNPNTIHMDCQAGKQVEYGGGNLGEAGNNQITQVVQPVFTSMSFQLVFDDMNPSDAFMLENISPTAGNAVSGSSSLIHKNTYSVQAQNDGLMALLTQDETRQVLFFWGKMCFRGELISVSSRYTMFNKSGNPIRGVVDLTIRQGAEKEYSYDETYWNQAFTKVFGAEGIDAASGGANTFSKLTNNNFLHLNL